ncbi:MULTISPECIES: hypothetical protein [Oscillatoriales]|uniref:hypothetical protein n=1 Tax=Oscillatoriales TaxID=1150 RepID=UPI0020C35AAB|nr:hypothetical protein [Oscillatoria sp. HE19RPO]MCT7961458.1 hypothetical protein [Laspinema sp. D2b]
MPKFSQETRSLTLGVGSEGISLEGDRIVVEQRCSKSQHLSAILEFRNAYSVVV